MKNNNNNIEYPKVLIYGETFTNSDGGGITLSNLFKDWPIDKLANVIDGNRSSKISNFNICNNIYILGESEKKTFFLFSFLRTKYLSGKFYEFSNVKEKGINNRKSRKTEIYAKIKKVTTKVFFLLMHFLGIYHHLFRIKISNKLHKWISEFNPDILYVHFNTIESMLFINDLKSQFEVKLIVHMMDDWPNTIVRSGLFKSYWTNRINKLLQGIFDKSVLLLSISESMSEEYKIRYGKDSKYFHNPVDLKIWQPHTKQNYELNEQIKLLYAGRIGLGTEKALLQLIDAVNILNIHNLDVKVLIQTSSIDLRITKLIEKYSFVEILPVAKYEELPKIFSSVDLLLLPYDLDGEGARFIKYSMPTKATEYMISGTPIFLYCSSESGIYKHAYENKWAKIVTEKNATKLKEEILNMLTDIEERKSIANNAINYASVNLNSNIIRNKFQNEIINTMI